MANQTQTARGASHTKICAVSTTPKYRRVWTPFPTCSRSACKQYMATNQVASPVHTHASHTLFPAIIAVFQFFLNHYRIKSPKGQTQGSSHQRRTIPTPFGSGFTGKGPHLLLPTPWFMSHHYALGEQSCSVRVPPHTQHGGAWPRSYRKPHTAALVHPPISPISSWFHSETLTSVHISTRLA